MAHFRFTGGEFKKYFNTPSDKAFDGNPKNPIKMQKCQTAAGVAACVFMNSWSIGYTSIGEALLQGLPIPLFKQNVRQKTPINAGNFRIIAFFIFNIVYYESIKRKLNRRLMYCFCLIYLVC